MTHPFLIVWLLLWYGLSLYMSILLQKKNVGDYSYMSSPNIYYRAFMCIHFLDDIILTWVANDPFDDNFIDSDITGQGDESMTGIMWFMFA